MRPVDPVLRQPAAERVKVNEIFYSIQGESSAAGRPCVLVRLTGCQMRCRWCDTEYAFFEGSWKTIDQVLLEVAELGCGLVEVTGGEPLLQPGAQTLLTRFCDAGYEVLLETGGGIDCSAVDNRVKRIIDVKCPGSGESQNNDRANLASPRASDEFKFVLSGRADYDFARATVDEHGLLGRAQVILSPVDGELDPRSLADWILEDRFDVRLQVQLHKGLWGADTRGV